MTAHMWESHSFVNQAPCLLQTPVDAANPADEAGACGILKHS